jgi:predicted ABC-type ATPase
MDVYLIAGSNGAGKTTFAREFLPYYAKCENFVNADLIAQGLSPFRPESAAFRAGRLVIQQVGIFKHRRQTFGFESTLSGKGHAQLLKQIKSAGYRVTIFYLWVPDAEMAIARIAERVEDGGHNVPPDVVRRRFRRSLKNFFDVYRPLADCWFLFDNSKQPPNIIASHNGTQLDIIENERYRELQRGNYE